MDGVKHPVILHGWVRPLGACALFGYPDTNGDCVVPDGQRIRPVVIPSLFEHDELIAVE